MLIEAISFLVAPVGWAARRSGHLYEQVATAARARRCAAAWAPHLAATRAAILDHAPGGGALAVLGSGALRDLPLAALTARYDRIYLIDAAHPWAARLAAIRYRHVTCVTADLLTGNWRAGIPAPDLTISLNLAGQLPIVPMRRNPRLGPEWAAEVIERHLADLRRSPALLICERACEIRAREGTVIRATDPLYAAPGVPAPIRSWDWHLAPFGEIAPDRETVLRVGLSVLPEPGSIL